MAEEKVIPCQRLKITSLNLHGAIGFDVDHCLIRYKIKALTRLCFESLIGSLIEQKGYHPSLEIIKDEELGLGLNYSVIDKEKGNVLKLGENQIILKGYRGTQPIDVVKEYGESRILEGYDPISVRRDPRFLLCSTLFENSIPLVFCKIVEFFIQEKQNLGYNSGRENAEEQESQNEEKIKNIGIDIDTRKLSCEKYEQIMVDIIWSLKENYVHYDDKKVFGICERSKFFQKISSDPNVAIYKQDTFKKILIQLRQQQKKFLFIATNSHYEFMNLTMSFAYGNDWPDLFDVVFIKSNKPAFFTNYNIPIYPLDLNSQDMKGAASHFINTENKLYLEGNYMILTQYINSKSIQGRILFLGDNILSDCYFPQQNDNWDTIAIMEELHEELVGTDPEQEKSLNAFTNYENYWGTFLFDEINGKRINNFWYSLSQQKLQGGIMRLLDSPDSLLFWKL